MFSKILGWIFNREAHEVRKRLSDKYRKQLLEDLQFFFGKRILRIVSFYQLNEIQVMLFPHDDVAVIRDELKAAFKNLPSIKHNKECISIRFCYGFNRKTAYLIVNPTDKEIRRRIAKDDHPEAFLLKEDFDKWKASLSNA